MLVALLLAPALAQEEPGCTRYVDAMDGADENPGTSGAPWRSLEHAAAVAGPGDVVCVRAGEQRVPDEVHFTVSGTEDAPIVFTTIDGPVTVHGALVLDPGVSHLVIDGFRVMDYPIWGVSLEGDNHHIVLSALDVGGGEAGVHFTYGEDPMAGPVSDVTLVDSIIHDTMYTAVDCTPGPCERMRFLGLEIFGAGLEADFGADGLAVERGADLLVEDCFIHDNGGDGIDLNSRDAGEPMPGIVVQRNRVANHGTNGIKLWAGGILRDNLVWNSGEENLVLMGGAAYAVTNNTFVNRTSYGYLALLGDYQDPTPLDLRLYNNIFYNDNPEMGGTLVYFSPGAAIKADHNLYFNPHREFELICIEGTACYTADEVGGNVWYNETGNGEHSLYADPLFVAPGDEDYRLSGDSPAIDAAGPGEASEMDLDRTARPQGPAPDIGAYEYCGADDNADVCAP